MKIVLLLVVTFLSIVSKADDCDERIIDCFSISPRVSLGVGILPLSNDKNGYLNVKVNLINYGYENAGMKFLGVGYGVNSVESGFIFSPMSINANKWLVSFDVFGNHATKAGVSFGISF